MDIRDDGYNLLSSISRTAMKRWHMVNCYRPIMTKDKNTLNDTRTHFLLGVELCTVLNSLSTHVPFYSNKSQRKYLEHILNGHDSPSKVQMYFSQQSNGVDVALLKSTSGAVFRRYPLHHHLSEISINLVQTYLSPGCGFSL